MNGEGKKDADRSSQPMVMCEATSLPSFSLAKVRSRGQSNLLGSEGNKEDGEGAAFRKTARVLNKHLLRRPINARSGARHGEEGWHYGL